MCLLLDHNRMSPPAEINLQPLPAFCNVQSLSPFLSSTSDKNWMIFIMKRFDIVRPELPIAELQMVVAKWKIEIKKRVLVVSRS